MKRIWIGRHRITIAREPMIGLGFDIDRFVCSDGVAWRLRFWFACWIVCVSFNEGPK